MIREASIDDAPAVAGLRGLVTPEFVTNGEATRHHMTTTPLHAQQRWWVSERDGLLVGWATAGLVVETSEDGVAWIGLLAHPGYRGRGIGRALADVAERHASSIGARRLHAWSRGDEAAVAFVRSRGYERTGSNDILVVDPRSVGAPNPPASVELRPFSAFEGDPSPIHHVDTISALDEPGELTFDNVPLGLWMENRWTHPLLDRDASVVAVVDGVPAAATFLQTDHGTGRATNNGTGTLPEYRGRGLATLAKRASLSRAAVAGVTAVYTGNDVTNEPMQAINKKLGYTPCSTMLTWAKDVTT